MYRATAGVVAVLCTLAFAVGLSAPAGAAASRTGSAFGPHDPGVSAHGTQTPAVQLPHAVAPLTQANFVVTDLASGNATVYEWSSVTPTYNTNSNCNMSKAAGLCLSYGSGPGPDGGAVALAPQSSSWTAGTLYPSIGGPSSVSVAGQNCNNVGSAAEAVVSSDLELDQYVFTSGSSPIQSIALQIDCTTATTDISGTIAYNIVPTNPSSGYYIYGQQGEITGFGNDNYLVYLDGAQYYNLNAPIVGMAATPDGGGYWMVGVRRRRVRQRRRRLLRLDREPAPEQAGGGHGGHPRRQGLLVRGLRRRHLRLRRRRLLRLDREHATSTSRSSAWRRRPTARATGWWPPTAASSPTATPGSTARPGASTSNKPIVGMAADPRRQGLLVRGLRRRHLRLRRRRLLRLDREHPPRTSPSSAWRRPPTATATGSRPPTAVCSTTATPPSTAAWVAPASPMSAGMSLGI